jgi:uncharacterized protein (DUF983 family)
MKIVIRLVRGFGHFWWDFFIGDTPELFVAGLVVLGIAALLGAVVHVAVSWIALPVLVVATLLWSLHRVMRAKK